MLAQIPQILSDTPNGTGEACKGRQWRQLNGSSHLISGIWKDTAKHTWEYCVFHLNAFLSQSNQQGPIVVKVVLDWICLAKGGFKVPKSWSISMQTHMEKTLPSNLRNKILKETAVSFYLVSFWSWFRSEPPLQNCTWQQIWHFLSSYWTGKSCKSSHCFPTEYFCNPALVILTTETG